MGAHHTRLRLLLVTALAAAPGAFAATRASAVATFATPVEAPPTYYVPHDASGRCRTHYAKRTVRIRTHRDGKLVMVEQVRCVYAPKGKSGRDGGGAGSSGNLATATIKVSILPSVTPHSYSTAAGQTLSVGARGVLAHATGSNLQAVLVTGPAQGSLTLGRDGSFSYTPPSDASGIERFVYRATNATGDSSIPASVTLRITPVAADAAYSVASGATLTIPPGGLLAGDLGTLLTADLVSEPADGSLTLNPDGSASYTPDPNFVGSDSFTYEVIDASSQHSDVATVSINVGP
jgi:hypothetical protein